MSISYFHNFSKKLAVLFLVIILVQLNSQTTSASSSLDPVPNAEAEEWVLNQILSGQFADLSLNFEVDERTLSSKFLEKLLTDPELASKIPRQGIRISNATFIDPIDINNANVQHEIWLLDCRFEENIDFGDSNFDKDFILNGSVFNGFVNFYQLSVSGDIYLNSSVFNENVSFYLAQIGSEFWANETEFNSSNEIINFQRMNVGNTATFNNAKFNSEANFSHVRMDHNVSFISAVFEKGANFSNAQIGNDFLADGAQFNNTDETISFQGMYVANRATFNKAEFHGDTIFSLAQIGQSLILNGAHFFGEADFNTLDTGVYAVFYNTIFDGAVDFISASIGRSLMLSSAQFTNPDLVLQFDYIKIGESLYLWDTVFEGGLDLFSASIKQDLFAQGVQFNDVENRVDFSGVSVGNDIRLEDAVVASPIYFHETIIGGNFVADNSKFTNKDIGAQFDNVIVGNSIYFQYAIFDGNVDFGGAHIGKEFIATNTQFNGSDQSLELRESEVGSSAWLDYTVFNGNISLSDSEFLDLFISGSDTISSTQTIDLSRSRIKRNLQINDLSINNFVAPSLVGLGETTFFNLKILDEANLENTEFRTLSISDVSWPVNQENFRIGGMTYGRIVIDESPPTNAWKNLLDFVDQAAYDGQIYNNLEEYIKREGNLDAADQIYIHQKRRERKELLNWSSLEWWWNGFLDVFVLYGRKPILAFVWSSLFLILGGFIFRDEVMIYQVDKDRMPNNLLISTTHLRIKAYRRSNRRKVERTRGKPPYNPFWYSLDLFLPVIDLKMANKWMPKPEQRFANHYMKIHTLIGWILISIGLLAITGIVR